MNIIENILIFVCVYSASRVVPREEHTSICYHWKIAKQAWEKYPPPAIKRSIGKSMTLRYSSSRDFPSSQLAERSHKLQTVESKLFIPSYC